MSATLLHSGKTEHFRALGDTGQPIYHSALQLRKVISRRLPGKERHLAIPQRDQLGEGVDWYSDIDGDVIAWSNATESEREDARIQLTALQQDVMALHQSPQEGQNGDHEVFTRLVKWVCHFPDDNFVYLVNGTPVITFWGFIHPDADRHANPLLCLSPPATPDVTSPMAPPPPIAEAISPEPVPRPLPIAPTRPWWRRWWWLLPLLLALGLLLFGLRACSSPGTPRLGTPVLDSGTPTAAFPRSLWQGWDIWPFNRWGGGQASMPSLAPRHLDGGMELPAMGGGLPEMNLPDPALPSAPMPDMGGPDMTANSGEHPGGPDLDSPAASDLPEPGTPPETVGSPSGMAPPELPQEALAPPPPAAAGMTPPTLEPLNLPADVPDGTAAFLNGNWRGAGVMDSQTGRPLQVTYTFDQGEGVMVIQRGGSAGMTCAGPVSAAMQSGQLLVEAQEQARCEDGSHYEMPRVQCHQANGETTSCAASYDDAPFPMQLRKAS